MDYTKQEGLRDLLWPKETVNIKVDLTTTRRSSFLTLPALSALQEASDDLYAWAAARVARDPTLRKLPASCKKHRDQKRGRMSEWLSEIPFGFNMNQGKVALSWMGKPGELGTTSRRDHG